MVTGGGVGIEAEALRGALAADGTPVIITPGGLDRAHPAIDRELFEAVAERGTVVSPYPLGTPPDRARSVGRRTMIAGFGRDATLLVEAGLRCPALHTAHDAHAMGRLVLVVPGPVTAATSAGAHRLAREPWARLVASVDDVLADLRAERPEVLSDITTTLAGPRHPAGPTHPRLTTASAPSAVAPRAGVRRRFVMSDPLHRGAPTMSIDTENPATENPATENPTDENPATENPTDADTDLAAGDVDAGAGEPVELVRVEADPDRVQHLDPRGLLTDRNVRHPSAADAAADRRMAASVRDAGVLQPIIAFVTDEGYARVRIGHRRTRGAIAAERGDGAGDRAGQPGRRRAGRSRAHRQPDHRERRPAGPVPGRAARRVRRPRGAGQDPRADREDDQGPAPRRGRRASRPPRARRSATPSPGRT